MLEGREDLACLWDLRVAPEYRGKGVGQKLFASAFELGERRKTADFLRSKRKTSMFRRVVFTSRKAVISARLICMLIPKQLNEVQLVWYRNL